jgi:hypothetical protein
MRLTCTAQAEGRVDQGGRGGQEMSDGRAGRVCRRQRSTGRRAAAAAATGWSGGQQPPRQCPLPGAPQRGSLLARAPRSTPSEELPPTGSLLRPHLDEANVLGVLTEALAADCGAAGTGVRVLLKGRGQAYLRQREKCPARRGPLLPGRHRLRLQGRRRPPSRWAATRGRARGRAQAHPPGKDV